MSRRSGRTTLLLFPAPVRNLKTSEAAMLLDVSPNTLRAWERRFGFPAALREPGKPRVYTHGDIAALRDALQEGLSVASAITRAREALQADTTLLVSALRSFELERADAAMEATLALRSVERSIEEVMLPALLELAQSHGRDSAPWAFAARWAGDWLHRAQRLAPAPSRSGSVILGDASRDELDPDDLFLQALELFLRRAGIRVQSLPISGVSGLADVLGVVRPDAVVISGGHDPDAAVARWVASVRRVAGALPIAFYRRPAGGEGSRTPATLELDAAPGEALRQVLTAIENRGSVREANRHPEVEADVGGQPLRIGREAS